MYESAEVNYRETQYGIRAQGEVRPIAVGPAEAERYRAAGVDIHRRDRTVYYDDVTEWREMTTTDPAPREVGRARREGER